MIGFDTREVERKLLSILKILRNSPEPLGPRLIARQLKDYGIDLSERGVRYHLKLMDERGLTELVSRDGRLITSAGREELDNALVGDKVGFIITRIETLAYRTTFDWQKGSGLVPINVSLFSKRNFPQALKVMKEAFAAGLCAGELVPVAESVVAKLKEAHLGAVLLMGNVSEAVCEVPVALNRVGIILLGGLNPVAAVAEAGIKIQNTAMGGMFEYSKLKSIWEL